MSSIVRTVLRRNRAGAVSAAVAVGSSLMLALTGCGGSASGESAPSEAQPTVKVSDAWVRATTGTDDPSMTGAFMALDNQGEEDVTLVGASSPAAGLVELHEMAMSEGSMVMRKIEGGIKIEAGFGKALMPGADHIMLMDLGRELAPGDEVELLLEFSDGTTEELTAPVKEFTEEEGHYHESDDPHSHSSHSHPSQSPSGSSTP